MSGSSKSVSWHQYFSISSPQQSPVCYIRPCRTNIVSTWNIAFTKASSTSERSRLTQIHRQCISMNSSTQTTVLTWHTAQSLCSTPWTHFSGLYKSFGLQVNTGKTKVMAHLCWAITWASVVPCAKSLSPVTFHINGSTLTVVDQVTYLGSTVCTYSLPDSEIHHQTSTASSTFGSLRKRVFSESNLKISTKVTLCNAICVFTLLFGTETWTTYRRHVNSSEMFHIRCLQKILNLSLLDLIPHTAILTMTGTHRHGSSSGKEAFTLV